MQKSATAKNTRQKPARKPTPKQRAQPRAPLTPDQLAALDVLFAAAKPGFELALGPAGTEINLSARLKRAKRYGYGAPTAVLFLDALPALDGLTRTEFRVLMCALARAPFGDNIAPISAATIAREIGLDRSHAAAAIRSLAKARILIEDAASKGAARKFYRITPRLLWRGGAYGYHAALAARPPLAIRTTPYTRSAAGAASRRPPWRGCGGSPSPRRQASTACGSSKPVSRSRSRRVQSLTKARPTAPVGSNGKP